MRQIPLLPALFLGLSLPVLLSACAACPEYIQVDYADGVPVVTPDSCTVKAGDTIAWRGPQSDDTPFTLRFDGDPGTVVVGTSPDTRHGVIGRPASLEVVAQSGPPREVKIIAEHDGKSTYVDYKYAVEANGPILDPHIIIRSEERRVGKECIDRCTYRWSTY